MSSLKVYTIDGSNFKNLEGFYDEISRVLIPGFDWGHNLDAFNDILRGGFGTPDEGFAFKWINADMSKDRLGYPETMKYLEKQLATCHASNREYVAEELEIARDGGGKTVFHLIVEIIRDHGLGGLEPDDNIELILEK